MPVLVNRTQKNFTMISNNILRDKELCLKDRGLLCTLCSLPDKWNFSIAGLCAIVPDGKESITNSLNRLEQLGYLIRSTHRDSSGKFVTEIEVFAERRTIAALPERETGYGTSVTGVPERANRLGSPDAENPLEYKTDHKKGKGKKDHIKSIRSDEHNACDGGTEPEFQSAEYKELIADNIHLNWLEEIAATKGDAELRMVHEIYDVICDMVCYPRKMVLIKGTEYPWDSVKAQFLKLTYDHVADALERVIDKDLEIKRMHPYLISTLYESSLTKTMETQAGIHDDYLKSLRGKPYSVS